MQINRVYNDFCIIKNVCNNDDVKPLLCRIYEIRSRGRLRTAFSILKLCFYYHTRNLRSRNHIVELIIP